MTIGCTAAEIYVHVLVRQRPGLPGRRLSVRCRRPCQTTAFCRHSNARCQSDAQQFWRQVVTLSRPPTISSLKITDRSCRYASPYLWNQLPDSFRQPRQSCLDSPPYSPASSSLLSSPLSSSITHSLFHSRLKTYLFNKSFSP